MFFAHVGLKTLSPQGVRDGTQVYYYKSFYVTMSLEANMCGPLQKVTGEYLFIAWVKLPWNHFIAALKLLYLSLNNLKITFKFLSGLMYIELYTFNILNYYTFNNDFKFKWSEASIFFHYSIVRSFVYYYYNISMRWGR